MGLVKGSLRGICSQDLSFEKMPFSKTFYHFFAYFSKTYYVNLHSLIIAIVELWVLRRMVLLDQNFRTKNIA